MNKFESGFTPDGEESYAGLETGAGRKSESPTISLLYNGHHSGDSVAVVRSDGTLERDWQFVHRNMETGNITLAKVVDGKKKEKVISASMFDQAQEAAGTPHANSVEMGRGKTFVVRGKEYRAGDTVDVYENFEHGSKSRVQSYTIKSIGGKFAVIYKPDKPEELKTLPLADAERMIALSTEEVRRMIGI